MNKPGLATAGVLAIVVSVAGIFLSGDQNQLNTTQQSVTSNDGTTIAFETAGNGPALVLVGAALADRDGTAKLAKLLAAHFTVINYDRRGRGRSTDTQPYSTAREVEDIGALLAHAGGSAYVFGSSSGAVLALEAASRLGAQVKGLFSTSRPSSLTVAVRPCPRISPTAPHDWSPLAIETKRSRCSSPKAWASHRSSSH